MKKPSPMLAEPDVTKKEMKLSHQDCYVSSNVTIEEFVSKAKLLVGEKYWIPRLTEALLIKDPSTIRKWVKGKHAIPGYALVALTALLLKKKVAQDFKALGMTE
jgi:hypothetical protein